MNQCLLSLDADDDVDQANHRDERPRQALSGGSSDGGNNTDLEEMDMMVNTADPGSTRVRTQPVDEHSMQSAGSSNHRRAVRRRPWVIKSVAAVVTLLVLAGCGGKSGDKDKISNEDLDESVAMDGDRDSDFCQTLRRIDELSRTIDDQNLEVSYTAMVDAAQKLPDQAPKDMVESAKVYVDVMNRIVEQLRSTNFDVADMDVSKIEGIDLEEFEAASTRMMKYQVDVCGVDNGAGEGGANSEEPSPGSETQETNNGD